jgi:hypothetical protein
MSISIFKVPDKNVLLLPHSGFSGLSFPARTQQMVEQPDCTQCGDQGLGLGRCIANQGYQRRHDLWARLDLAARDSPGKPSIIALIPPPYQIDLAM